MTTKQVSIRGNSIISNIFRAIAGFLLASLAAWFVVIFYISSGLENDTLLLFTRNRIQAWIVLILSRFVLSAVWFFIFKSVAKGRSKLFNILSLVIALLVSIVFYHYLMVSFLWLIVPLFGNDD